MHNLKWTVDNDNNDEDTNIQVSNHVIFWAY